MRFLLWFVLLWPALSLAEPVRVFTSVLPLRAVVESIGGDHVEAQSLVRPGFNPHTYEPTPQQITALSQAALFVRTGVPFEDAWMRRIAASNPAMQILDVREGMPLSEMFTHEHDAHDHEDEIDPHVWTSPLRVKHMAALIHDRLSLIDPDNAADYRANHAALLNRLDAIHADVQQRLAPFKGYRFMVFHPAWGYFAEEYGLIQVPIERGGKEPGAKGLATLIDQARQQQIHVVFVQPQFDQRLAQQVANAIDGEVIAVDPLSEDIIFNLPTIAAQFAEALQP